jgi:hepatocyte growth factor-regulated tyrosine kinase substrate
VFCGQCSGKTSILPKFGIEKEVRVCDGCYDQLQKPQPVNSSTKKEDEDLPAEYLASSLSQQNQQPVRKTEEELREEEELQLALALSQSEAESKKQQPFQRRTYPKSPSPSELRSPTPEQPETPSDPELARYLNRSYWEQRQAAETTSNLCYLMFFININVLCLFRSFGTQSNAIINNQFKCESKIKCRPRRGN